MRDFFLFLIFLFAVTELEDRLFKLEEDTAGKGGDQSGEELEFLLFVVCGKEGFGGFAHVPVDFGQFVFAQGLGVG
jgi:hypothetical protein